MKRIHRVGEDAPSREYQAIEQLEHVPGVLLLTATPEQLGMESPTSPVCVCWTEPFHDFAQFVEETEKLSISCGRCCYAAVGNKLSNDETEHAWRDDRRAGYRAAITKQQTATAKMPRAPRQELVSMLMDRHGTSRAVP